MLHLDRAGPARRRFSRAQVGGGALFLLLAAATSPSAFAQWSGQQPATLSSYAIFSVSGNTVTITEPASPVTITVNGYTNTLLGISGIWIVDSSGNTVAGVAANAGQGSVSGTSGTVQWTPLVNPAGYHDPGTGSGYGSGDAWLQLASNSLVSSGSGKSGTGYTTGTFTFAGLSSLSGYDFGIDYLQANAAGNGNTGRAFFASTPAPVPEPGAVATVLAMGGTTALGILRGRRPRRRSSAA